VGDKHISADFRVISIEQKARHCKVENRVKTTSAVRRVDLHPSIAVLLKEFVGERKSVPLSIPEGKAALLVEYP
jgi:hypothetical protein